MPLIGFPRKPCACSVGKMLVSLEVGVSPCQIADELSPGVLGCGPLVQVQTGQLISLTRQDSRLLFKRVHTYMHVIGVIYSQIRCSDLSNEIGLG